MCIWLHVFNNGNIVQDYYLRAIINKRIVNVGSGVVAVAAEGDPASSYLVEEYGGDDSDDNSSAGDQLPDVPLTTEERIRKELKASLKSSLNKMSKIPKNIPSIPKIMSLVPAGNGSSANADADTFVDQLSQLFGMISLISCEQFAIISKVFPPYAVCKVTRLLLQR